MMSLSNKHRRPWTPKQDEALIFLKDELKVVKWPQIAKKMVENFKLGGRTEKQCRDRYVNFLQNADNSYLWRVEDQNKLIDLFYELGNRWSEIATSFPNTNGIYIKNKFYSRLRKAIRHINTVIQSYFSEIYTKFTFDIIFKLVNLPTKKSKISENPQIKELLESNPKVFQDIIVKLVYMTNSSTNYHLKKKKIQRITPKDQIMWRKLIQILKYLEKQVHETHSVQYLDKDFHLQTNHNEGFRNFSALGIKILLGFSENTGQELFQQKLGIIQHSIEAGYIQLWKIQQSMLKWKKPIIIISDQKRFCDKEQIQLIANHHNFSKKEETLAINETLSIFERKVIKEDINQAVSEKDEIMSLPSQKNEILQP